MSAATRRNMRGGSQFDPWANLAYPSGPPPPMEKPSRAPEPVVEVEPEPVEDPVEVMEVFKAAKTSLRSAPKPVPKPKPVAAKVKKTKRQAPLKPVKLKAPVEAPVMAGAPRPRIHPLKKDGPDANIIFVDRISLKWEPTPEEVARGIRYHTAPSEQPTALGGGPQRIVYGGQTPTHNDWRDSLAID